MIRNYSKQANIIYDIIVCSIQHVQYMRYSMYMIITIANDMVNAGNDMCYIHGFLHTYCSRKSVRTLCARA